MAGEIQLNSTTMATESSGSITAQLDTIRPNTTNGSLVLQGDSSDAGVTGLTIDSSGNATFAGTGNNVGTVTAGTFGSSVDIKAAINASGSAPIYACRAWVLFDGTGTPSITDSGNVASISDNGTGNYTINFSTDMPHANYSLSGMFGAGDPTSSARVVFESAATARSVSSVTVRSMSGSTASANATYTDTGKLSFSIFC